MKTKVARYRRWVYRFSHELYAVGICSEHDCNPQQVETSPVFVRWLDMEWQNDVS